MQTKTLKVENHSTSGVAYIGHGVKFEVPGYAIGDKAVLVAVNSDMAEAVIAEVQAKQPAVVVTKVSSQIIDMGETIAYTLLNAQISPGVGSVVAGLAVGQNGAVSLSTRPLYKDWSCQISITGNPTEVVVRLEGNLSGNVFTELGRWRFSEDPVYANGQGVFRALDQPACQIRGDLVTLEGGLSPKVTMKVVGTK